MDNKTITILLDDSSINKMIDFYSEQKIDNKNEYVLAQFKIESVSITIYTSKKVVFQGENALYEASIWDNSLLSKLNEKENKWKYSKDHIGSDEVGTGDYFGPICVCAAYVKEKDFEFLDSLGVNDSKKLTDEHIRKITPKILKHITYSQVSVDPSKYNSLIKLGYNQAKIKAMLHNQVIHLLKEKINKKVVYCVIDQFITPSRYYDYIKFNKYVEGNIHFETKAESKYLAVAVASIIARYSFLKKIDDMSTTLGEKIPKGAGKDVDIFAKKIKQEKGMEYLEKFVKLHFANTNKLD